MVRWATSHGRVGTVGRQGVKRNLRHPRMASESDTEQLLAALLQTPPPEAAALRPVRLQSRRERQRHALRGRLVRTWVDAALTYAERGLLLALLLFAAGWFYQTSGRDWLHRQQVAAAPVPPPAPPRALAVVPATVEQLARAAAIAQQQAQALPFTPPNPPALPAAPDYLAPAALSLPKSYADPRPFRLSIPAINLDTPVEEVFVQDGAWQVAHYAAGYHHGSAYPGEGNTVLAGHAGLYGAVFAGLGALQPGTPILLDAGEWRFVYRVREQRRVLPTDVAVMHATPDARLTLITCTDWDTRRIIVIADFIESKPL